jgi:DNA ligase D-like protein (predicted polymerase)
MVMKRYPDGIHGQSFFMKRAPDSRPDWIETCTIAHKRAGQVPFPMVQDLASLLWVVNLGCIDLNPWYARCDDTDRPDYLHFDLDPGKGASFSRVLETALVVREALEGLGMKPLAKTSGASGMHIYVPIVRGRCRKSVASREDDRVASRRNESKLITAEYLIAKRPRGRVLVDYNQNAWAPYPGVDLFGETDKGGERVQSGHLERCRAGHQDRRFPDGQCAGTGPAPGRPVEAVAAQVGKIPAGAAQVRLRPILPRTVGSNNAGPSLFDRAGVRLAVS